MNDNRFVSYGQNREDVVLWRALQGIDNGSYVDVGANDPRVTSLSRAFYDRGWSGITVEPVPTYAAAHREQRPRDVQVQAAVTDADLDAITLHVIGETGLSTLVDAVSDRHQAAGWAHEDITVPARRLDDILTGAGWTPGHEIHFVSVDVEGAEPGVIRSFDLAAWRPWILVIEATAPNSAHQMHSEWEELVLAAGYTFCLFDGLSRYYASPDHPELVPLLSYPACPLDQYVTDEELRLRGRLDEAERNLAATHLLLDDSRHQTVRWRSAALVQFARPAPAAAEIADPGAQARIAHLESELAATRRTLSWRVTAPLRVARRLGRR